MLPVQSPSLEAMGTYIKSQELALIIEREGVAAIKFTLGETQAFKDVFQTYMTNAGIPAGSVKFVLPNGQAVDPSSCPRNLGLKGRVHLTCVPELNPTKAGGKMILIGIQLPSGIVDSRKMKSTTQFKAIHQTFVKKWNLDAARTKFYYDGNLLNLEQTPEQVGMDNNSVIMCFERSDITPPSSQPMPQPHVMTPVAAQQIPMAVPSVIPQVVQVVQVQDQAPKKAAKTATTKKTTKKDADEKSKKKTDTTKKTTKKDADEKPKKKTDTTKKTDTKKAAPAKKAAPKKAKVEEKSSRCEVC